jgi:hypothetical protein
MLYSKESGLGKTTQMSRHLITNIAFFVFVIACNPLVAQQKYEKESRLKEKEVPSKALDLIEALEVEEKKRWYLEEALDHKSIEAKFRFNDKKYSIEFDTMGNLEDIEIQVKWNDLSQSLRDSITTHLEKDCKKAKIRKVQIQYSGDPSVLISNVKSGENYGDFTVRYELVVKCRKTKQVALFEYLFSDTGQVLSIYQIIFKNSSNLEY